MKNVKPISARQMGELARLLEEREIGEREVQKMVEGINKLAPFFFKSRGFSFAAVKDF